MQILVCVVMAILFVTLAYVLYRECDKILHGPSDKVTRRV